MFRDKHWKTLNIARGFAKYFHDAKIYKTSAGYVVLGGSERKKFKSWKLVERRKN